MMANKLTKEMFQEVIAFFVSEWGAMGPNGTMGFYTCSLRHPAVAILF